MDLRYSAGGLINVTLRDLPVVDSDDDGGVTRIPRINVLHRLLVEAIALKHGGLAPIELRFLRTEMDLTQGALAAFVGRDLQTVGRWERGESPLDRTVEVVVRAQALETVGVRLEAPMAHLTSLVTDVAEDLPLVIDASDPNNYRIARPAIRTAGPINNLMSFTPRSAKERSKTGGRGRTARPSALPLLKMAARSSAGPRPGPEVRSERVRTDLIGRIIGADGPATLRKLGSDVLIDLPAGRRATKLRLGVQDYDLSACGRTRRYRVDGLTVGAARRFALDQAENPAGYPARWI